MSKADEEEWKDIIGYEGKYQVSNLGRIKSLCRVVQRKNGHIQTINERILKPTISNKGYYMVSLDGKTYTVHRLEALAFLGKSKLTVNHINGIKTDNRIENLEFVTHKENCIKAWQTGLCENVRESAYKIKHKRDIKTSRAVVQTDLKGNIINKFVSIREAEEKTGIHNCLILGVCQGKHYTTHGYVFKYIERASAG